MRRLTSDMPREVKEFEQASDLPFIFVLQHRVPGKEELRSYSLSVKPNALSMDCSRDKLLIIALGLAKKTLLRCLVMVPSLFETQIRTGIMLFKKEMKTPEGSMKTIIPSTVTV